MGKCDRCRCHKPGEHAVIIDEGWEPPCLVVCDDCYEEMCCQARSGGVAVNVLDFAKVR